MSSMPIPERVYVPKNEEESGIAIRPQRSGKGRFLSSVWSKV